MDREGYPVPVPRYPILGIGCCDVVSSLRGGLFRGGGRTKIQTYLFGFDLPGNRVTRLLCPPPRFSLSHLRTHPITGIVLSTYSTVELIHVIRWSFDISDGRTGVRRTELKWSAMLRLKFRDQHEKRENMKARDIPTKLTCIGFCTRYRYFYQPVGNVSAPFTRARTRTNAGKPSLA
jgi:hypothetical protein